MGSTKSAIPLLVLDVFFLQLDVLQLALQPLQIRVFIAAFCCYALEVFDARNSGRNRLPKGLGMADGTLD